MKIRNGFVSNSSSSSFVCDICGIENCCVEEYTPNYDGWCVCSRGHTIELNCIPIKKYQQNNFKIEDHEIPTEKFGYTDFEKEIPWNMKLEFIKECSYIMLKDDNEDEYDLIEELKRDLKINRITNENEFNKIVNKYNVDYNNFFSCIPKSLCPICNFEIISYNDIHSYVFKKIKQSQNEIIDEIKNKFKDYESFTTYLYKSK